MSQLLNRKVLKLNRAWQVIGQTTVEEAIKQMCVDAATALYITDEIQQPLKWAEWLQLAPDPKDGCINTQRLKIRVPTVIICVNFAKVPKRRPKFCAKSIRERDGNRCQYTGKLLQPTEGSMDHVDPLSRGGANTPDNVVWCEKEFNNKKGNKTPEEMGLVRPKIRPLRSLLMSQMIEPTHPHHVIFLTR